MGFMVPEVREWTMSSGAKEASCWRPGARPTAGSWHLAQSARKRLSPRECSAAD